ncbi:Hypothetical predicted protein [Paramuricea clavata]|uniref:Uncharacterized protein n=1 Tax=Paramuricea clavata TaxID=317549 RepID=A0A7D9EFM2_PARCT|nr:Hypothetical predicted protein [Paramuricea clavata]
MSSSGNGSEASLDLLKCLSLSEVIQKKKALENGRKNLDDRQGLLERQKDDMLNINKVFRNWLTHLQKKVERNNQQLPYLWCIKDICKTILTTLGNREGDFYTQVKHVYAEHVPGVSLMCERLEELRRLVTKIDHDEVTYKPGFVEDIHHVLGTLLGLTGTILDVYF